MQRTLGVGLGTPGNSQRIGTEGLVWALLSTQGWFFPLVHRVPSCPALCPEGWPCPLRPLLCWPVFWWSSAMEGPGRRPGGERRSSHLRLHSSMMSSHPPFHVPSPCFSGGCDGRQPPSVSGPLEKRSSLAPSGANSVNPSGECTYWSCYPPYSGRPDCLSLA